MKISLSFEIKLDRGTRDKKISKYLNPITTTKWDKPYNGPPHDRWSDDEKEDMR